MWLSLIEENVHRFKSQLGANKTMSKERISFTIKLVLKLNYLQLLINFKKLRAKLGQYLLKYVYLLSCHELDEKIDASLFSVR